MVDLSCRDWEKRIRECRSLMPDLPLNDAEVEDALGIFNALRLPDQEGMPPLRDMVGDWFKEIVAATFGSWNPASRERFIREIFCLAPKGSSKTTNAGGLAVTAMAMNMQRVEMLIVSDTQAISELTYNTMVGMIAADEQLARRFKPRFVSGTGIIDDLVTNAVLEIRTFSTNVLTGVKPVFVIVDELHLLGKRAGASKVMVQLRNGIIKQANGVMIILTTQSLERPVGVFAAYLERARAIRDGKISGQMLPILYEFPKDIASDPVKWQDPKNWPMVLPNLGRSQRLPDIEQTFKDAVFDGEHMLREWASQQLNIQIGIGMREGSWAGAEYWERGALPKRLTLQDLIDRCEVIVFGVDGGGLDDLYGLAACGRERDTRRWLLWAHAYISPEGMQRRKGNAEIYESFRVAGDLTIVDELPNDLEHIVEAIKLVKDAGLLAGVGVDKMSLGGLVEALKEIDVTEEEGLLGAVSQGIGLQGAIKTAERKLVDGSLKHGGQPMMDWCAGNAIITPTATGIRMARDASGYGKIDPLVAAMNAIALMSTDPEAPETLVYTEHRGLLFV